MFWTLAALLLYLGLEAAVFRSGWYSNYLEPDSSAGQVEYHLHWLRRAKRPRVPDVVVVGDSRIAEGFAVRTAASAVYNKLHFTNFGLPGSAPRVWYYLLRDADPERNRFAAIVLAFDQYSDQDGDEDPANRQIDLNFLGARLGLSDCGDFSRSFIDRETSHRALTGCLFRGKALRADVQNFLVDIPSRIDRAKDWRDNGAGYIEGYGGKSEELTGLSVDREKYTIDFPARLSENQQVSIRSTVLSWRLSANRGSHPVQEKVAGGDLEPL